MDSIDPITTVSTIFEMIKAKFVKKGQLKTFFKKVQNKIVSSEIRDDISRTTTDIAKRTTNLNSLDQTTSITVVFWSLGLKWSKKLYYK